MTEEKINCEDIEQEQGGMEGVPLEQECGTQTSDHIFDLDPASLGYTLCVV